MECILILRESVPNGRLGRSASHKELLKCHSWATLPVVDYIYALWWTLHPTRHHDHPACRGLHLCSLMDPSSSSYATSRPPYPSWLRRICFLISLPNRGSQFISSGVNTAPLCRNANLGVCYCCWRMSWWYCTDLAQAFYKELFREENNVAWFILLKRTPCLVNASQKVWEASRIFGALYTCGCLTTASRLYPGPVVSVCKLAPCYSCVW